MTRPNRNLRAMILITLPNLPSIDYRTLASVIRCSEQTAHRHLTAMHAEGRLYVSGWLRDGRTGPYRPAYTLGPGTDAPRPPCIPKSVSAQAWRDRNPDAAAEARKRYRRTLLARTSADIQNKKQYDKRRLAASPPRDPILDALTRKF